MVLNGLRHEGLAVWRGWVFCLVLVWRDMVLGVGGSFVCFLVDSP